MYDHPLLTNTSQDYDENFGKIGKKYHLIRFYVTKAVVLRLDLLENLFLLTYGKIMSHQRNEQELVAQAQRGDEAAITYLYEAHVDAIFEFIRYRVASKSIAEDLTSEVFLRMVRGLDKYHDQGFSFRTWLFRIAANIVIDHYRQQSKNDTLVLIEDHPGHEPDPLDHLIQSEDQSRLYRALRALPENYQDLILLRFMENLSHIEIAKIMDKSTDALRSMQYRALKALGEQLERLNKNSEGSHKGEEK